MIKYVLDNKRCALLVPMGMGKTVAVLTAIDIMLLMGELERKVLVVAPVRVAKTTWPDEVSDPEWPHLNHLKISPVIGTESERTTALKKWAHIYTINYENLPWLEEKLQGRWPFEMVVADESTKLKGFRIMQGTKRARVLGKVAHSKTRRFIQLTGTPAPNGIKDLWALGWFIDKGKRLGRTYTAFVNRWFSRSFNGFSIEPLPHSQTEIENLLKDVCFSLDVKDHFDIKDPIRNDIWIDLPPKARKKYNEMEKQLFTQLKTVLDGEEKSHSIEAVNAAVRTMKCLQLANGAAYVGEGNKEWAVVHDEKLKALEDVIEEASGAPILVAYHFKSDLARLKKAFPQGRYLDKDPQTQKDWNDGKIPLLFAHPASAGHGLNIQHGGNILVFFSINWNLEEHQQIIERIGPVRQKQSGYDRPVFVHYIMARNTVDIMIRQRLETKQSVQEILLQAMKRRM